MLSLSLSPHESLMEQVTRQDPLGECGTPFRFWVNTHLPASLQQELPVPARILDLGCGSGVYYDICARAGLRGEYWGVDIAEHHEWRARTERSRSTEFPAMFHVGDVHELAGIPRDFDGAIAITAFEHFQDEAAVLGKTYERLNPGAKLTIVVPSHLTLLTYWRHGLRRYGAMDGERLGGLAPFDLEDTTPIGGFPSLLLHALWFNLSALGSIPIRRISRFLCRNARSVGWGKKLRLIADNLMYLHQLHPWGQRLHVQVNRILQRLDRLLPCLPSGYLYVLRRR